MGRTLLLTRKKHGEDRKEAAAAMCAEKHGDGAVITNTDTASSVERQENSVKELAGTIRKGSYSVLWDGSLNKSVEFARRCNKLGVEAKVVPCLAVLHLRMPLLSFKIPLIVLHFYTEVLGKQYEVLYLFENEKQSVPKLLARLGRFKVVTSKPGCGR